MKRFKNILLVADFEARQQVAVDRAVSLVKRNDARLSVVTVIEGLPPDLQMEVVVATPRAILAHLVDERREILDSLVESLRGQGVDANAEVLVGTPFLEVIRRVNRDRHDLVILAAEGRGGLGRWLFGSTSLHLMRKCPCPVWVVKAARRSRYRRILAAVDTTGDAPDATRDSLNLLIVQLAASLARMDEGELHLVQAWSVFGESYLGVRGGMSESAIRKLRSTDRKKYSANLDALLAASEADAPAARKHLPRSDDACEAIVRVARRNRIDLLVMGTICRTGIAGFFIGNTAEKVLNVVECSVLTVKPEGFVTPVR